MSQSTEDIKQNLINDYVMLLRIKAAQDNINPVLEAELTIIKVKMSGFDIDLAAIEKFILN